MRVSRARKKLRVALAAGLIPLLALVAIALSPSKHDTLLQRAFGEDGSEILHWRIRNTTPGLPPSTQEIWMHVTPSGAIDKVRELLVAGRSKGNDRVFSEPYGIDDPWHGDISYVERSASGQLRTLHGLAYSDNDMSVIVSTLKKAARGHLDLPERARGAFPAPARRRQASGAAEPRRITARDLL